MGTASKKFMEYLGLADPAAEPRGRADVYEDEVDDSGYAPTEAYEDTYIEPEPEPQPVRTRSHLATVERPAAVRRPEPVMAPPVAPQPAVAPRTITKITPTSYNQAKTIGEHFRQDVPVIMNLTEMPDADAKRLVDFAAGLIFGLHGSIERVTAKVFLLTPSSVTVTDEERARIAEGGFFNQS